MRTDIGDIIDYNQYTGELRWKITNRKAREGNLAGFNRKDGYLVICIDSKKYLGHRIAYYIMTGSCPEYIDHIDRDPSNNKWENLREVTQLRNLCNTKINNKFPGVDYDKRCSKWRARLEKKGKRYMAGYFETHLAACYARWQLELTYSE